VQTLRLGQSMLGTGYLQPVRPDRLAALALDVARWGISPVGAWALAAHAGPDRLAVVDDRGALTYRELHQRANALAHSLRRRGVEPGAGVAILCRNHRGFAEATVAASKLGARVLFLNTAFAPPQLADVVRREDPAVLVYDHGLAEVVEPAVSTCQRVVTWVEEGRRPADPTVDELVEAGDPGEPPAPARPVRFVVLTSGTTGAPKGAQRDSANALEAVDSILSKVPLRARQATVIASPLFHAWGFFHLATGLALGSTLVLRARFDPETALSDICRHRATTLVVVPVMLRRILDLPPERLALYGPAQLGVIASSGSALPGPLALRAMDTFGDVLYNVYGSTEVAWASIATPADLRAAPGTAGRPPRGTVVRLYDQRGRPVEGPGRVGRIFVGNRFQFEGYTGGGTKTVRDGLMATGDVGHFDGEGRLWVDGRDDEMVVSGGENVFPAEVESLLSAHEAVEEVAAVGVDDEEFGQRLKAFVVLRPGATLTEDEVKAHVRANLARYKVPREVEFLDSLPRNAAGKVVKAELGLGAAGRLERARGAGREGATPGRNGSSRASRRPARR